MLLPLYAVSQQMPHYSLYLLNDAIVNPAILSSKNEDWSITLFHYRNHGNAYGRVLIGISSDNINENEIKSFLSEMNFNYTDESNNLGYQSFLK